MWTRQLNSLFTHLLIFHILLEVKKILIKNSQTQTKSFSREKMKKKKGKQESIKEKGDKKNLQCEH